MRTILSDFLGGPSAPGGRKTADRDGDSRSQASESSTADTCPEVNDGLRSAPEAKKLFGSLFNSAELEDVDDGSAVARPSFGVAHKGSSVVVEKREKKEVDAWTAEEDMLILKLVEMHGKRWSKIAASLPGRSDNGVRNRWNRIERANAMREAKGSDAGGYRCRRCGLPKRGHTCAALTTGVRAEDLAARSLEISRISSQLAKGIKKPNMQSKSKLFKAAGNVLIAVDRMERPSMSALDFLRSAPAPSTAKPRSDADGVTQHGIAFEDAVQATRRHSSMSSPSPVPERPLPDRHTGLSGTFGQTSLSGTGDAGPKAPLDSDGVDLSEDNFSEFLMELHQSIGESAVDEDVLPPAHLPMLTLEPLSNAGTPPALSGSTASFSKVDYLPITDELPDTALVAEADFLDCMFWTEVN